MSAATDKKLWLLDEADKEHLIAISEVAKRLDRGQPVDEMDFGAIDMLQQQAYRDFMLLKPKDSTYDIRRNLLCMAGHCLLMIKKIDLG